MHLKNVTLELSGKPFYNTSEERMREVCVEMFTQWKRLTDGADRVSVMLWISDGSEILTYSGGLEQEFEWAYWVGCAQPWPVPADAPERRKIDVHCFPRKYREDVTLRSYAWLKRLIETIRETGRAITGKPIRIGATFDNGPEFAISKFKYETHREIAQGHSIFPNSFVTCNTVLHADTARYAAFPHGIPEGTSLGTFLGAQYAAFARDLGYDYIWLSNGMGFGTETWKITGALFDGEKFHPDKAAAAKESLLRFWRDFKAAAPDAAIETRGSNFSAGTEMASDAAPLREIYHDYKIAPPVNPPWAALNFNSGLELAAWMSHVAELPGDYFPYRFYTHDPWFYNSPWLDRYGRLPWDIYMPLSVCRIDENGKAQIPNSVAFLSVDDTYGNLPAQVPDEVIPHIKTAFREAPDAPGLLVWIYPFEEYGRLENIAQTFNEDIFLGEALQNGLPLNTVISTGNFRTLRFAAPLLVASVTAADACLPELRAAMERGSKVLVYGSMQNMSGELAGLLGLCRAPEISGSVTLQSNLTSDAFEQGAAPNSLAVAPHYDGGGLCETAAEGTQVLVEAVQGGERRVIASLRGNAAFVRSLTAQEQPHAFPAPAFARQLLGCWGWQFQCVAFSPASILPRLTVSRHKNGFFFSGLALDSSADMLLNTPFGAPVPEESATRIKNGAALWRMEKSLRRECRCFVKQAEDAVVTAKIDFPAYPGVTWRVHYSGLQNAEVRFFPPPGFEKKLEVMNGPERLRFYESNVIPHEWEETPFGPCVVLKNISGFLYFTW